MGFPITYVPARRNTIFLSFGLGWAEVLGAWDIFIGVNALDYSGYPDCRPEFIRAFERTANLGTRAGIEGTNKFHIHTPLIQLRKFQIIQAGRAEARRGLWPHAFLLRSGQLPRARHVGGAIAANCVSKASRLASAMPDPARYSHTAALTCGEIV